MQQQYLLVRGENQDGFDAVGLVGACPVVKWADTTAELFYRGRKVRQFLNRKTAPFAVLQRAWEVAL